MAGLTESWVGILGLVLLIVGLIMIIVALALWFTTYSSSSKPAWLYVVLILGIILLVVGLLMIIYQLTRESEVVSEVKTVRRTTVEARPAMM